MTAGSRRTLTDTQDTYKAWSGTDGKFDPSGREKWNDYTVTAWDGSRWFGEPGEFLNGVPGEFDTWTANDQLALLAKLVEKVQGHSFRAGIALAEGKMTVDLAVGTARKLANFFVHLKRGNLAYAARTLGVSGSKSFRRNGVKGLNTGDISSLWLEIQYGWKPLLSDVHEAGRAWEHAWTSNAGFDKVTVKHSSKRRVIETNLKGLWGPTVSARATYQTTKQITVKLRNSDTDAVTLGLTDPYTVAWELVPYSFVVDWFIPIGNFLDLISQVPRIDSAGYLTTTKLNSSFAGTVWYYHTQVLGGKESVKYVNDGSAAGRRVRMTRLTSSTLSVPRPQFKSMAESLSTGHLQNAMALLHQAVRK